MGCCFEDLESNFLAFPYFSEEQTGTQIKQLVQGEHGCITCLRAVACRRGIPRPHALWALQKVNGRRLGACDATYHLSQTTECAISVFWCLWLASSYGRKGKEKKESSMLSLFKWPTLYCLLWEPYRAEASSQKMGCTWVHCFGAVSVNIMRNSRFLGFVCVFLNHRDFILVRILTKQDFPLAKKH